ncbi:MAG TPA: hypothetical protein VM096_15090 [Vicinamibacterales bacterium]|nr:hypothetical protein [Vicinamibacterales bacterium]
MAVWDDDTNRRFDPPNWLFTGHMLLWGDGSPAHIDMEPFRAVDAGWEANLMVSRSTMQGTRWLTMRLRLSPEVRAEWESQGRSPRARALQVLAIYLRLTEWYEDDIGLLELK